MRVFSGTFNSYFCALCYFSDTNRAIIFWSQWIFIFHKTERSFRTFFHRQPHILMPFFKLNLYSFILFIKICQVLCFILHSFASPCTPTLTLLSSLYVFTDFWHGPLLCLKEGSSSFFMSLYYIILVYRSWFTVYFQNRSTILNSSIKKQAILRILILSYITFMCKCT